MLNRFAFGRGIGSGLNTQYSLRRDLNLVFGYDDVIDLAALRYEYDRGGIAARVVDIYPDTSWGNGFDIVDDKNLKRRSAYEKEIADLYTALDLYQRLIRTSRLSFLYHYSILLLGAPGSPDTPLPKGEKLEYVLPLGEDKARIESLVGQGSTDERVISNPRYGLPEFYQVNMADWTRGNTVASIPSVSFSRRVHWSRIIHCVRDPLDSDIYCGSILEKVWDLLHDNKKTRGGGAEAFLRRAWPGLHLDINADAKLDKPERDEMSNQLDEYFVGLRNGIQTRKTSLSEIVSKGTIDFKTNCEAIIQQIAGSIGVPWRLFVGGELGKANSEEDKGTFNDNVSFVRKRHNEPLVRRLHQRLVDYGYLTPPKNPNYQIVWPEQEELDEEGKARVAKLMKDCEGLFTDDEIRDRVYKMSPREVQEE